MVKSFSSSLSIKLRMHGGEGARIKDNPHVVEISKHYNETHPYDQSAKLYLHHCGGSIIDYLWIVTAAHCFQGTSKEEIRITFATNDYSLEKEDEHQHRFAVKLIIHEDFNTTTRENDIALIKLNEKINFTKLSKAIPLLTKSESMESNYSILTGFRGKLNKRLRAINILLIDPTTCESNPDAKVKLICGASMPNDYTTEGDSGSGYYSLRENSEKVLIGIHSFRLMPHTVYGATKISYFAEWINSKKS